MYRPRLFLDANILVDAQVRDIFLTISEARLIDLRWSEGVLDETRRVLIDRRDIDPSRVDYLISTIKSAFPEATVTSRTIRPVDATLPDKDDLHVLAAAVSAECEFLVTNNVRDFPADVIGRFGLSVINADNAIALLAQDFTIHVPAIIERLVAQLRRPPITVQAFLTRLAQRAPTAAQALSDALGGAPGQR